MAVIGLTLTPTYLATGEHVMTDRHETTVPHGMIARLGTIVEDGKTAMIDDTIGIDERGTMTTAAAQVRHGAGAGLH